MSPSFSTVIWVIIAFASARFFAMGINRIVDRDIDAANPRTRDRELPSGRLTVGQATGAVVVAAVIFVVACAALNPLTLTLCPVALGWIGAYSYAKRFTSWAHVWLGFALAMAPAGGYIAVQGTWSDPWTALLVIALGVTTWVAGFDIFYALPDAAFDRSHGLHSAVVAVGERRAILLAKLLHGVSLVAFAAYGVLEGLGGAYLVGVGVAAVIIGWEHQLVKPGDLSRLDAAFFTANGIVSIVIFIGALGGRLL
jgi:4-hydroxybenzoate polyprenyltransferase